VSPVPGDAKVPGSWLPASGEISASKRSDFTSLRGWQLTGPQHQAKPAASLCIPPVRAAKREPSRSHNAAKAMEGVWDLGAGVEEPSGVMGVERSEGCPGNWRGPTRPRCAGREASLSITAKRERAGGREGVGGGRSSDEGRDNRTRLERRAPASSMQVAEREVFW
jgi:hypothetical protein